MFTYYFSVAEVTISSINAGRTLVGDCSAAPFMTGFPRELMFSSCIVLTRHLKHTIDVKGVISDGSNGWRPTRLQSSVKKSNE